MSNGKVKEGVILPIEGQLHLVQEKEQHVPSFEAAIADTRANLAEKSLQATGHQWEFPTACTKDEMQKHQRKVKSKIQTTQTK